MGWTQKCKRKSLKIKPRIQLGMLRFGFIYATGYEKSIHIMSVEQSLQFQLFYLNSLYKVTANRYDH